MRTSLVISLLVAASAVSACEQKEGGSATAGTSAAAATGKAAAGGLGLANPANDKAVVELATKALKCAWSESGLKWDCPDFKAWQENKDLKSGSADPTLVNMLEDKDEKVRWLAAKTLPGSSKYTDDKALAQRVVTAAEQETNATVAAELGYAANRIRGEKTGLGEAVKKLITAHKLPAMRRAVVSGFMFNNSSPENFKFVADLARNDKEIEVRRAAASSFWVGTPNDMHADACKLWLELSADADKDLSGHSSYHCAFYPHNGGCKDQWNALLDLVEKKSKEGTVQSSMMASALKYLYDQKEATDAQKKRAIVVAKALVENDKNDASARSNALELVGKNDPGGKAYAAKFENDKEFFVKNAAQRIKEGK